MPSFVPVNEPLLDGNESRYLQSCIESGWISSEGPFVTRFEQGMAALCGRRHAVAVANGTVALEVAVRALGIGPGDEVILPTFTIISCAAAVVHAGAVPVVVDCDARTWNMDVSRIEQKITARTKAIMAVHIYGLPVEMDPLLEIAQRHGVWVIEDAAQMHGQSYRGRPCGSFGDVSTFSFYPNKLITTGEGGMVLTDDEKLAERSRSLRNLCFQPARRFVHDELGFNFRMTNMQAALGLAQLEKLSTTVARKRAIGRRYRELLSDIPGIELPPDRTDEAENLYWVFGVVLDESVGFDASAAMKSLHDRGVGARPFFWPMHEQPVFLNRGWFRGERYPVAERLARRGFYLPSGVALSSEQMDVVAKAMHEILA